MAAHLERWALLTPDYAAHVIRFLTEPTSRTYMIAYPPGESSAARTWRVRRSASAAC